MLSKEPSSTIIWVFGITQTGIKLQSPGHIYIYIYIYILRVHEDICIFLNLFILFLHTCYIYVRFQLVAFVREHMWHKALLIGDSMRLELTVVSSIKGLWLVRLFYIGIVNPFSCSVFTLVGLTRLWYFICL